jgi:DNA primase
VKFIKTYAAQGTEVKKICSLDNEPFKKRQEPKLSEQIKAGVSVMEFISRTIELKPTDTGAVGCCPFHTDQHPNLGVNREQNYWYCFAVCGGGLVIDFWMKWRICNFKTVVSELAKIVL